MISCRKITPLLAELCGIIVGDGHMRFDVKNSDYRIEIVGHKTEDADYFEYVAELFRKCFGKSPTINLNSSYARLCLSSKAIVTEFKQFGVTVGNKARIARIPKNIIKDESLALPFLRGLADTDFSVCFKKGNRKHNSYPRIVGEFASPLLVEDISIILRRLLIFPYRRQVHKTNAFGTFTHHRIEISGRKNFARWMGAVGFSNSKHLTKIALWEKSGHCPPYTTLAQRRTFLGI